MSNLQMKEMKRCAKITSKSACIENNENNFCSWESWGKNMEMNTVDTSEEIKNKYGNDVYKKSCLLGKDGTEEISWRYAICNIDSDSDKKFDLKEFKNDPNYNLVSKEKINLFTKVFNEVKGSDNKINRCQYKK